MTVKDILEGYEEDLFEDSAHLCASTKSGRSLTEDRHSLTEKQANLKDSWLPWRV